MKTFITKTAASLGVGAMAVGTLLVAPAAATAATDTEWAYSAPWVGGSGQGSDCLRPDGSLPSASESAWDFDSLLCTIPEDGVGEDYFTDPVNYIERAGLGQVTTEWGVREQGDGGMLSWAYLDVRRLTADASFTIDLAEYFSGLTGRVYVPGADPATGTAAESQYGQFTTLRGHAFTVTAVEGGVRVDTSITDRPNPFEQHIFDVVVERTDGLRQRVHVAVASLDYGGAPEAAPLDFEVSVGEELRIPRSTLLEAATFKSGEQTAITLGELPDAVREEGGDLVFVSDEPTVESFTYAAEELQTPATNRIASAPATVTITAVEAVEPQVIAPTVRDFTFDAPQAKGDASTGTNPAEVPVLSLTEGEDFDPTEWRLEAADVMPWSTHDGRLFLFPEEDGVAFETRWRWASLIDPEVTSEWATVTAPAAPVVEPPVEEEPPTEEPPVTEPPVVEPPVVEPPVLEPPVTEPPAEEEPPAEDEPRTPTPFKRAETGDDGSPLWLALPGAAAVLALIGGLTAYRRLRPEGAAE